MAAVQGGARGVNAQGVTVSAHAGSATWLECNTWDRPRATTEELLDRKAGRTISALVLALDEDWPVAQAVGSAVTLAGSLLDEIVVVVEPGSYGAAVHDAAHSGVRVETPESALPGVPLRPGRGEVLWRSLAATDGDVVAVVDAALADRVAGVLARLVEPMLLVPDLHLVLGYHPSAGDDPEPDGSAVGTRLTELLVRPLIAALCPALAGVIQPLGGEFAGTRELLRTIPFAPGHGVGIGMLVDAAARFGIDAIGQVDLGPHGWADAASPDAAAAEVGSAARQVVATLLGRLGIEDSGAPSTGFLLDDDGPTLTRTYPVTDDRPPLSTIMGELLAGGMRR
ncbi:glucosyl-3-phosphoglycerate synthase [Gordonia jinghuaiqii]|uniref:Glucosyl-3-phosphoglycerate synthase n=1 Tax=Gordonia jinghuaiqii TaxID=2758710 RepID=A0A7D7RDD2_9ACTN|nr:glucosyl-3-phosphoglycerate synthase [Gordonia jinghuaiqii]MCR5976168.1 glucosyl-3-phosphoglycerate synthase [Gordonia jinghuaiqii]QMT03410.1 glucosyl-3-phosphoglycerate synthase [Gordonia jinghuaiqii]